MKSFAKTPRRGGWIAGGLCLAVGLPALVGCGDSKPFKFVKSSGTIVYEDGTPLPVDGTLRLTFYSQAAPVDGKYQPRAGTAFPDESGAFSETMTLRPGDGLIAGVHRVTIGYMGRTTDGIVGEQYTLKTKTPIEVDTAQQPFEIRVPKP